MVLFVCVHKGATDVDQYVVVYNPLAWNITTFVTVSVSSEAMSVYDELGRSVPAQVLQLCFFLLRFSHLSVFIDWILPSVIVGFSYLSFKGCFYLPVFSTERLFLLCKRSCCSCSVFGLSFACLLCVTWCFLPYFSFSKNTVSNKPFYVEALPYN